MGQKGITQALCGNASGARRHKTNDDGWWIVGMGCAFFFQVFGGEPNESAAPCGECGGVQPGLELRSTPSLSQTANTVDLAEAGCRQAPDATHCDTFAHQKRRAGFATNTKRRLSWQQKEGDKKGREAMKSE